MIPRSIWRWMILDIKRKKKEKRIRLLGGLIGICVAVVSLIYMFTSALAIYDSTADRVTFSDFVKDNMLAFFVAVGLFVLSIISIILVLLQKARKAEAVAKLAAGMNGHIAKPIQVDKLLSTLKDVLTENIIL